MSQILFYMSVLHLHMYMYMYMYLVTPEMMNDVCILRIVLGL